MTTNRTDYNGRDLTPGCNYNAEINGQQIQILNSIGETLEKIEQQHSTLVTRLIDRMDNKDSVPLKSHYIILISMACAFGVGSVILQIITKGA